MLHLLSFLSIMIWRRTRCDAASHVTRDAVDGVEVDAVAATPSS